MSYFITNYCFFTGRAVISTTPPGHAVLDGYYYTIWYNGHERAVRLYCDDDWLNSLWVQQHGKRLIKMIDTLDRWDFFDMPKDLAIIQYQYERMKVINERIQAIQKREQQLSLEHRNIKIA